MDIPQYPVSRVSINIPEQVQFTVSRVSIDIPEQVQFTVSRVSINIYRSRFSLLYPGLVLIYRSRFGLLYPGLVIIYIPEQVYCSPILKMEVDITLRRIQKTIGKRFSSKQLGAVRSSQEQLGWSEFFSQIQLIIPNYSLKRKLSCYRDQSFHTHIY